MALQSSKLSKTLHEDTEMLKIYDYKYFNGQFVLVLTNVGDQY